MTPFTHVVMIGWIPAVVLLFQVLEPRRAVLIGLFAGWLFLPNAEYTLSGFPDYNKLGATALGVFLGSFIAAPDRYLRLRLGLADLPIAILCIVPFFSAISNDLGVYAGISAALDMTIRWGLPYAVGRAYFGDLRSIDLLARAIVIGGLIYAPLCLWEIRMSPQLHADFYGFRARLLDMGSRYGGYRPIVFMWSYLPVVHWLCVCTVMAAHLRLSGQRRFQGFPLMPLVMLLIGTLVLCKTASGYILAPLGVALGWLVPRLRSNALAYAVVLAVPAFVVARVSQVFPTDVLVESVREIDAQRAHSLWGRLENEDMLIDKALRRPMLGWGGDARWRVFDPYTGEDVTVSDGLWTIRFGSTGLIGLFATIGLYLFPLLRFLRRVPARAWRSAAMAPAAGVALVVLLTMVNIIPNTTISPIITCAIGALAALRTSETRPGPHRRRGGGGVRQRLIAQDTAADAPPGALRGT